MRANVLPPIPSWRRPRRLQDHTVDLLAARAVLALLVGLLAPLGARATSMVSYVHVATAANITGVGDELTELDDPLINDNPDARLLVTQHWDPPGGSGVYNDHPIGVVYYDDFTGGGSWYIRNQDDAPIPAGAGFNVLVLGPGTLSFVHLTSASNCTNRATFLNPIDPDCLLCPPGTRMLFTHTQTFFGIDGGPFDYHASLLDGSPTPAIVTESRIAGMSEPMPYGVLFNVLVADSPGVASSPGASFRHVATTGNSAYNWTYLSHPELDGNPTLSFSSAEPVRRSPTAPTSWGSGTAEREGGRSSSRTWRTWSRTRTTTCTSRRSWPTASRAAIFRGGAAAWVQLARRPTRPIGRGSKPSKTGGSWARSGLRDRWPTVRSVREGGARHDHRPQSGRPV